MILLTRMAASLREEPIACLSRKGFDIVGVSKLSPIRWMCLRSAVAASASVGVVSSPLM
jgi:hypothetical protein